MDNTTKNRIEKMFPMLDERALRRYLAIEANGLGHGGITDVSNLTGVSRTTITRGIKELENESAEKIVRIRKKGGGRKKVIDSQIGIEKQLNDLLESNTVGNPENPLKWTAKSLRNLADALENAGFKVSHDTVGKILVNLGYSLQMNKKCLQVGSMHPDRNAQFEYINNKSKLFIADKQPVISVDTKKKELIGNFKNNGAEYSKKHMPTKVLDHDFPLEELGKVNPYGIYDINENIGFVNLGTSKDTAEFAVESILRWWNTLGKHTYPNAKKLYINCDGGGSNGSRVRLWKKQLQEFANITGLEIHVSHFPAGTSKWNKIEHKMFCFISKNWRGKPLISIETTIDLISSTTTTKGLKIKCVRDNTCYELGKTVSDEEFEAINILKDDFHGEWNYSINKHS